jgi:hypothetical protein
MKKLLNIEHFFIVKSFISKLKVIKEFGRAFHLVGKLAHEWDLLNMI